MPTLAAIVLAAGRGERFGGDKLSASLAGRTLLDHATRIALASPAERVIVVARPGIACATDARIRRVEVAGTALSDSLRAGLAAAGDAQGAFVFLGDMPLVPEDMAERLAAAIGPALAALPDYRGAPGHPVLLVRRAFGLVDELTGDEGLGRLLRDSPEVVRLPVEDEGVILDVDRLGDLAALQQRLRS